MEARRDLSRDMVSRRRVVDVSLCSRLSSTVRVMAREDPKRWRESVPAVDYTLIAGGEDLGLALSTLRIRHK